jgi:hypothetical protein
LAPQLEGPCPGCWESGMERLVSVLAALKTWMAGTRPAMTVGGRGGRLGAPKLERDDRRRNRPEVRPITGVKPRQRPTRHHAWAASVSSRHKELVVGEDAA